MNNFLHDFLLKILAIDSTTGSEDKLGDYLATHLKPQGAKLEIQSLSEKQQNLFFKWGHPHIIFCTHLDTVPPYIPPSSQGETIYGRGACDAKGQIAAMYATCQQLYQENQNNFGLLLLADEEQESRGAKLANDLITGCKYIIIGEPTDNKLISAAKGIALIEVTITGKAAHSGYPENGENAIERLRLFLNKLAKINYPQDPLLGDTTYNIGTLHASNSYNVISDQVTAKIFFRTTFTTHNLIQATIQKLATQHIQLRFVHSNPPLKFLTVPGFAAGTVAFGSDAPTLNKLGERLLYGPGSILTAHTKFEQIKLAELNQAVKHLKMLYYKLVKLNSPQEE